MSEPQKVAMTLRLDRDLMDSVKATSRRLGSSVTQVCRLALTEFVARSATKAPSDVVFRLTEGEPPRIPDGYLSATNEPIEPEVRTLPSSKEESKTKTKTEEKNLSSLGETPEARPFVSSQGFSLDGEPSSSERFEVTAIHGGLIRSVAAEIVKRYPMHPAYGPAVPKVVRAHVTDVLVRRWKAREDVSGFAAEVSAGLDGFAAMWKALSEDQRNRQPSAAGWARDERWDSDYSKFVAREVETYHKANTSTQDHYRAKREEVEAEKAAQAAAFEASPEGQAIRRRMQLAARGEAGSERETPAEDEEWVDVAGSMQSLGRSMEGPEDGITEQAKKEAREKLARLQGKAK